MKYLILFFSIGLLTSCQVRKAGAPESLATTQKTYVRWEPQRIDLGSVRKGEKRNMAFVFQNTTGESVQIDIVDACECTTTDFPRGVIAPGDKGTITAIFDSTEKDADETIDIRVIFKNTNAQGIPQIDILQYSFKLLR